MSDLTISMILKLVDQASAPARKAQAVLGDLGQTTEQIGQRGVAWSNQQIEANKARQQALMGEAMGVAALAGSVVAALQPAIRFEQSMAEVGAVANASDEDLAALTSTARELGAKTSWSASQAAEGMKYLSMAGFEANETIAAMPGMLNLASAGATDLGQAADIASDILSAFQMEAGEIGHLGDVLTNTFTSSNTDLSMLGETMKYVAPVAQSLGISLEDTAAMAGKLGDAGIKGSMAGTSLRAMMSRLAAPTKEARNALKALGVQTLDADGNLRDFHTILAEIDAGLDQFGTGKQQDLVAAIAGLEAASAATVLLDMAGSGALQNYSDSLDEAGSAARIAAQMNDTAAGALKRLGSITESLAISVGSVLLPELVEILDAVMPVIAAVEQWAAANPELVSWVFRGVAALIAFKAASIAVRFALFGMLGPILQVVRGFSWVLVLMPRLMGGVMGFGRLLLWLNMTPIKAVIGSVKLLGGLFVKLGALVGLNPIGAVMMALVGLAALVYSHWDEISVWFSTKMEAVRAAFDQGLLQGVFKVLAEFNPFRLAVEGLQALLGKVLEMIGVPDQIVQAFTQFDLFGTGADLLQSLWNGMASVVPQMVGAISSQLSGIMPEWMKDAWNWVSGGGEAQQASFAALPDGQRQAAELLAQAQAAGPLPTEQYLADLDAAAERQRALIDRLRADLEANPIGENMFGSAFDGRDNRLAAAQEQLAQITQEQDTAKERAEALQQALAMVGETDVAPQISTTSLDEALEKAARLAALLEGTANASGRPNPAAVPPIAGMRDQGGPVRAGLPYIVGERAPELFVPNVAGQILPARALSAMVQPRIDSRPPLSAAGAGRQVIRQGDTINMTINAAPGMDAQAIAREVERVLRRQQRGASAALHDGGDYA